MSSTAPTPKIQSDFNSWFEVHGKFIADRAICKRIWDRAWGSAAAAYGEGYRREEQRADQAELRIEELEAERDALQQKLREIDPSRSSDNPRSSN